MIHVELLIAVILVVFVIRRRTPIPWRVNMVNRVMFTKLNRIESAVTGIPIEEVEQRFSNELDTLTAKERGRPWFGSRPWLEPPLN